MTDAQAGAQANEQLIRDFFTTLSSGDLEKLRGMLHPEASWTAMVKEVPGAGRHAPRNVVIDEFLAPVRGIFEEGDPKVEIDNLFASGNLVCAETRAQGKLRNGKDYNNNYCWVFEVQQAQVYAIREYMDSHYVMSVV